MKDSEAVGAQTTLAVPQPLPTTEQSHAQPEHGSHLKGANFRKCAPTQP